jgi:hypothetical protein
VDGLVAFGHLRDAKAVKAYAVDNAIAWYLPHPSLTAFWPTHLLEQAVFTCDGYRVFHFMPD